MLNATFVAQKSTSKSRKNDSLLLEVRGTKKSAGAQVGKSIDSYTIGSRGTSYIDDKEKINIPNMDHFSPLSIMGQSSLVVSKFDAKKFSDLGTDKRVDTSDGRECTVQSNEFSIDRSKAAERMYQTFGYGKGSLLKSQRTDDTEFYDADFSLTEKEKTVNGLN